jgi:hypothetical protein
MLNFFIFCSDFDMTPSKFDLKKIAFIFLLFIYTRFSIFFKLTNIQLKLENVIIVINYCNQLNLTQICFSNLCSGSSSLDLVSLRIIKTIKKGTRS